mmetsp:Transcript_24170/g.41564  ORF Transcript_24170/g.41564 Transcript_24170/m.41564 type:complete len:233 (+) Transcript_24170:1474-2172(+)
MGAKRSMRSEGRRDRPTKSMRWWREATMMRESTTAMTAGEATSPGWTIDRSEVDSENVGWVVGGVLGRFAARAEVVIWAGFALEAGADDGMHIALRACDAHVNGYLRNGLGFVVRVLRIRFGCLVPFVPVPLRRARAFRIALALRGHVLGIDEAVHANAVNGRGDFQQGMRRVMDTFLLAVRAEVEIMTDDTFVTDAGNGNRTAVVAAYAFVHSLPFGSTTTGTSRGSVARR